MSVQTFEWVAPNKIISRVKKHKVPNVYLSVWNIKNYRILKVVCNNVLIYVSTFAEVKNNWTNKISGLVFLRFI